MDDIKQILVTIIEKGELQLTDAERKEILEKKRREIGNSARFQ
jgi:ribosome maturation protein Sdo1